MNNFKVKIFSFIGIGTLLLNVSCKTSHLFTKHQDKENTQEEETVADPIALADSLDATLAFTPDSLNFSADSLVVQDDSLKFVQASRSFNEPLIKNTGILHDPSMLELLEKETNEHFYSDDYLQVDESKYGDYEVGYVPNIPEDEIKANLDFLDKQTTIDLTYHPEVKKYIDLYGKRHRNLCSRMLGLGQVYFPGFEEMLDKYGIPLEMKYLPIVESALNPTAGSHAGAAGLWQFMYATGKMYDLKVTTLVDDRYDPKKSTEAACKYLRDLYSIYKDWSMVLVAYNTGPGNVNKAIRRAGGVKNYWAIWPFLPRETRSYVPKFIAMTYLMNFPELHNLRPQSPGISYSRIDTVTVKEVLAFDQINEFLHVPMTDLEFLNPQYKRNIIPAAKGKQYALTLPREYVADFMNNEDSLYRYVTKKGLKKEKLMKQVEQYKGRNVHIVRSGESLGLIARKYRCSVASLKKWNRLRSNMIRPGQKLVVFGSAAPSYSSSSSRSTSSNATHTVKRGENLGSIANRYGLSVSQLKSMNGLSSNMIRIGQQLKVRKNTATAAAKPIEFPKNGKKVMHTIKKGENPWTIAKKYPGSSVNKIMQLNDIKDVQKLKPGMVIVVDII